jgi:LPXTG-motif cell wall-anchored protein
MLAKVQRTYRLVLGVVVSVGAVVAIFSGLAPTAARAFTGTTGPVNVTITPTADLTVGQVINVHAEATSGTMSELRAHICTPAPPPEGGITNTFDFGYQGDYCSNKAPGGGDAQKVVVLGNTTSGDLTFKAGVGTVTWKNEFGDEHTLQCDSTHPCDLVVQIQSSVAPGTYFITAHLTYAAGGTATTAPATTAPTVPPTTAPPTTVPPTTAPPTTAPPTTVKPTSTTAKPTTTTSTTSTSTTVKPTTTTSTTSSTTSSSTTSSTVATGATTTTVASSVGLSSVSGSPGSSFTVNSNGWQPNSSVVVKFNSDPITLGTPTANNNGVVSGSFSVPSGVAAGSHTVTLTGTAANGNVRTLSAAFTVTSVLPRTGSNTREYTVTGVGLLLVGAVLTRARRRHLQP